MEDGRRGSDGGVGSKSSLTWACHRLCPFMHAGHRPWAVISCAVVFVCVHSIFVCVHLFPFVGMRHCPVIYSAPPIPAGIHRNPQE